MCLCMCTVSLKFVDLRNFFINDLQYKIIRTCKMFKSFQNFQNSPTSHNPTDEALIPPNVSGYFILI